MSSDELMRVARSIRKDETPDTFHRVICELGRRGTTADYDSLGRGEEEERAPVSERVTRQLRTVGMMMRVFLLETVVLVILVLLLLVILVF